MTHDSFTISTIGDICNELFAYKDKTDWQVDFYDIDHILICTFSSDEETLGRMQDIDDLYQMVTEEIDIAIMMGTPFDL